MARIVLRLGINEGAESGSTVVFLLVVIDRSIMQRLYFAIGACEEGGQVFVLGTLVPGEGGILKELKNHAVDIEVLMDYVPVNILIARRGRL